ncbi:MAG: hypothetical protein LQ339_007621 [Xanthoria mediterranea]|nr:MAG: hypothetical protein LQ339_007621 [Xanthoria mediterranea]
MVYTVALVALSSLRFYDNVAITFSMASTIFFLSLAVNILSSILPTSASPLAASSNNQSSSSPVYVAVSRPPKPPICPKDLGPIPPRTTFFARDCENAVAMIPRDIRPSSPLRNFYLLAEHVDPAMPNVQLPFERESVQLLMASSFMHVPHERATWMDIWGPSRLILQQCTKHKNGGIITNIGVNEGLDLAIYSKRSLFASARRLRDSSRATTNVAEVEFLQLLGLLPAPRSSHRPNLLTATAAEGDESGEVEEAATTA